MRMIGTILAKVPQANTSSAFFSSSNVIVASVASMPASRNAISKLVSFSLCRPTPRVKNPFVGVSVKLEQGGKDTKIVYSGFVPRLWARFFFGGLIGFLLWNGLTNEVKQLIETAPEFK